MHLRFLRCLLFISLSIAAVGTSAAPVVSAFHVPPPVLEPIPTLDVGVFTGPFSSVSHDARVMQTFIPTISGRPTSLRFRATRDSAAINTPLLIDVARLENGQIMESVAMGNEPAGDVPSFLGGPTGLYNEVILAANGIVMAGAQYALVFRAASASPQYKLATYHGSPYANGMALVSDNGSAFQQPLQSTDVIFALYVEPVPEPSALALSAVASALVPMMARRYFPRRG